MSPSSSIESLVRRLPFDLTDTDAVNDTFERWASGGDQEAKRHIDLWTYCYIWKYFLTKKARDSINEAADLDDLIARAYQKVEKNRSGIDDTTRYASWVSVVCKNTFLNYARRDRVAESIHDDEAPELVAETDEDNPEGLRETILRAIDRLPEYLQETARLYFLEKRTFREISEVIGKDVPTVRTYKYKAIQRLRDDEELKEYIRSS